MPLSHFQLGDRVIYTKFQKGDPHSAKIGNLGTIICINRSRQSALIQIDGRTWATTFFAGEFELFNPTTVGIRHRAKIAWQRGDYVT